LVENESAVIDKELYLAMQLHNQNHEASVAVARACGICNDAPGMKEANRTHGKPN
jgi:hypothetical protein